MTIFFDFTYEEMLRYRKPPAFYPKKLVADAFNDPVIIHYTTSIFSKRPWIEGCKHKYVDKWLECKAKSPWMDTPLWKDKRSGAKRMVSRFLNRCPKKISVGLAGVMQKYVRPFINSLK